MEQLSLFGDIDEKEVRRKVARELKRYKAIKVALVNKQELDDEGLNNIFPTLCDSDKLKVIKYKQIHRALNEVLDETERNIIERKYLGPTRVKDISIYLDLGLKKEKYYELKKSAISLIATALRII